MFVVGANSSRKMSKTFVDCHFLVPVCVSHLWFFQCPASLKDSKKRRMLNHDICNRNQSHAISVCPWLAGRLFSSTITTTLERRPPGKAQKEGSEEHEDQQLPPIEARFRKKRIELFLIIGQYFLTSKDLQRLWESEGCSWLSMVFSSMESPLPNY